MEADLGSFGKEINWEEITYNVKSRLIQDLKSGIGSIGIDIKGG